VGNNMLPLEPRWDEVFDPYKVPKNSTLYLRRHARCNAASVCNGRPVAASCHHSVGVLSRRLAPASAKNGRCVAHGLRTYPDHGVRLTGKHSDHP